MPPKPWRCGLRASQTAATFGARIISVPTVPRVSETTGESQEMKGTVTAQGCPAVPRYQETALALHDPQ